MGMGERISLRRKELGYTMEELGNKVGVQKSAVNKWEKGFVDTLKRTTIKELANVLECSPAWLMFGEENSMFEKGQEDAALLVKFHQLNSANKAVIISTLDAMLNAQSGQ